MQQLKLWLRDYWLIGVAVLGIGGFLWWQQRQPQSLAPVPESSAVETATSSAAVASSQPVAGFVHIKGAIAKPGLYPVDGTTRWDEVVKLAGGLTAKADVAAVNLAAVARDQESLLIPEQGAAPTTAPAAAGGAPGESAASLVNINTADATQLQTLSGIGPKKAADIIAYRDANGPFADVADLKQVSGIGEKTFEALQDAVTIGP